ncbi:transporter [uncultured Caballeronia sp.]|uniref:SphA family protein n=1 Tax=uncultured Caballeronia sp. TaxID=1827198 RepID=UPI0035C9BC22
MTRMTTLKKRILAGLVTLAAAFSTLAFATEGGGDNIGQGSEGFFAGMLPGPGWYGVLYTNYYHASRFNDSHGNSSIPGFNFSAEVLAARLFYMSNLKFAGGRAGAFAIGDVASLQSSSASGKDHRNGVGDITLGSTIGWDFGAFHPLLAVDIVLPVGGYDMARGLNIGGNYYSVRPIVAFTYLPANGIEVSAKITYTFNVRNADTDYRSGQIFHFDYSVSHAVTKDLRLGVNGYYVNQTTDDYQHGRPVDGDGYRGQVAAIGPAAHYQFSKVGVDLKVLKEFAARNRTEGTSIWAKLVVPF